MILPFISVEIYFLREVWPLKIMLWTHRILISTYIINGCEAWSLTLREKCRLKVFEDRILRRVFGPKRDENGEWRGLHDEELHSLYRSPNLVRVIKSRRLR